MASILVVDDHAINRQFLLTLLGYCGHRLFEAADGAIGLEVARAERPDLIISDILMPRMDGVTFVTRLHEFPEIADTPVIFYTATYREREATVLARACGVKWVLPKPSNPEVILAAVQVALGQAAQDEVSLPVAMPKPEESQRPSINRQFAEYLLELETTSKLMAQMVQRGRALMEERGGVRDMSQRLSRSLIDLQSVGLRLTSLIELGINLAEERDPAVLLRVGCHAIQNICTAKYAVIGILDDAGDSLRHFYSRGLEEGVVEQLAPFPPHRGVLGSILDSRQPQLNNEVSDPQALGLPEAHPAIHTFLGVAIATSERVYGWAYVVDKLGAPGFSDAEKLVASTIAAQLAVAYENLVLYGEVLRQHSQLQEEMARSRRATEQLLESEGRFRQLAENLHDVFFLIDPADTRMLYISPAYETVWRRSCASLYAQPQSWKESIHPDDVAVIAADETRRLGDIASGGSGSFDYQFRVVLPDGEIRWIHSRGFPIFNETGEAYRIAGIAADVTQQVLQQQAIDRLSRIYAVLSGVNSAIVRLRDRGALLQEVCRIAVLHGAFQMAWAGVVDVSSRNGKVVAWYGGEPGYVEKIRFTARTGEEGSERPACVAVREMRQVICDDISIEPTLMPLRDDLLARGHRSLAALPLIVDNDAVAVIALFADSVDFFKQQDMMKLMDELAGDLSFGLQFIKKEEQLNFLAYYDALTSLPNRALFSDRLAQFLHSSVGVDEHVAAIVINLDHFAHLNDLLGRHAGDALLQMIAQRLLAKLREPFSLARIGGDTFAIALSGLRQAADAAALLEQQVLAPLTQPFGLNQQEIHISVKAGISLYPGDGRDAESLLRHAETALKKAKSSGERYLYYAPQMNAAMAARLALEHALSQALESRQFEMYYQPRVDLLSGRIVSAEALIRWLHPERGLVSPTEFIPLAEETGQIVAIGDWVIDAVCAQQAAWQARRLEIVPVALNLSAVQFKRGKILETIGNTVARHVLEQRYIEFELTESVVMDNPEQAVRDLQALKKLGAQLSLDDFGTGYSSLAYLKRFPFDFVKIDRSFITDVTTNPDDAAIATAIIAMGHSLGLRVVAEGVETEEQLLFLRQHRCDELQGYYFSRPVPAAEFAALLREDKRLTLAT